MKERMITREKAKASPFFYIYHGIADSSVCCIGSSLSMTLLCITTGEIRVHTA